jgi:hypothetical protein
MLAGQNLRFTQTNQTAEQPSAVPSLSHPASTDLVMSSLLCPPTSLTASTQDIQTPLPPGLFGNELDLNELGFNLDAIKPTTFPDNWMDTSLQGGWDYSNNGLTVDPSAWTSNEVPTPPFPNVNATVPPHSQTNANVPEANHQQSQLMQGWNGAPFPNIPGNGVFPMSQASANPSWGTSGPHASFHASLQTVPSTSGQQGSYYPPLDRPSSEPPFTWFPASQSVPQMQPSSSLHTNIYNNFTQALPATTQTAFGPAAPAAPFPNDYPFFHSPFAGSTAPFPFAYPPPQFVQPGMPNYATGPHPFPHYLLPEPTLPEPPQPIADVQLEGSNHESQLSTQKSKPTKSKGKGKARAKPYNRRTKNGKKNATEPEEKGVRLPDEPELSVLINGERYFALNMEQHPLLYRSLPTPASDYDTDTVKYARVTYKKDFERPPRYALPESEAGEASTSDLTTTSKQHGAGRPGNGIGHRRQKKEYSCPCGRRYAADRSIEKHIRYQTEAKDPLWVTCCALRRQRKSEQDRCVFCDQTIGLEQKRVEAHFWTCKPLAEMKTLIRTRHLRDCGLLECELKAFSWPVVPVRPKAIVEGSLC